MSSSEKLQRLELDSLLSCTAKGNDELFAASEIVVRQENCSLCEGGQTSPWGPREAGQPLSLETLRASLGTALSNLT